MQNETIEDQEPGLGEVESGTPAASARRSGFGLRGRLTFAFGAVAAAGLVSCGVALVQFESIREGLDAVTKRGLPAITAAQNVAAESARLAASAPMLDSARSQEERYNTFLSLRSRFGTLNQQIKALEQYGVDPEQISALEAQSRQMMSNVEAQDGLVRQRLDAAIAREKAVAQMTEAHEVLLDELAPLIAATSDAFTLAADSLGETTDEGVRKLAEESVGKLILLYDVRDGAMQLARAIGQTMNAASVAQVDDVWREAVPVTSRLHSSILRLSGDAQMEQLVAAAKQLLDSTIGDKSVFEYRKLALDPEAGPMARIEAAGEVERLVGAAHSLEESIEAIVTPAIRTAQVNIRLVGIDLKNSSDRAMRSLIDVELPRFSNLMELAAKSNRLAGLLAAAATAPTSEALARSILEISRESSDLEVTLASIADQEPAIAKAAKALLTYAQGAGGIPSIRMKELEAESTSAIQLAGTRQKAEELGMTVAKVVASVQEAGDASAAAAERALTQARMWLLVAAAVGALVALGFALVYVPRAITNRLLALGAAMRSIAAGDLEAQIPAGGKDEIAEMAEALVVFRDNAREIEAANARALAERQRAAEERRIARLQLADAFEASVQSVVGNVGNSAIHMQDSAARMSGIASRTSDQVRETARASDQAASNVQVVASTAEELASSIAEISRQVAESTRIAGEAVNEAEQTTLRVRSLAEASERIGAVVNLIQSIAAQTNLLALNATIEAARAGEAGRGFAVVANEVKTLASQTAKATEEIGEQIAGMQRATTEAVSAIDGIGQTISKISDIASSIAAAVEEQGAATAEIARSVQEVAAGTAQVSSNMGTVAQASSETGDVAGEVLEASRQMSEEAARLKSEVGRFLAELRAA